jgi:membrane protease YdiL (CAAX protease family)
MHTDTTKRDTTLPRHWPMALLLGVLGGLGAALVVPYALALLPQKEPLPMSVPAIAALAALQNGVLLGVLGALALRVTYPLGLDAPLLRRWLRCGPSRVPGSGDAALAAGLGIVAGLLVLLGDAAFAPFMPKLDVPGGGPDAFTGLLASFYGGISEELFLRLIVMGFTAALLTKLLRRGLTPAIAWSAIAFAALLFGVGHLPAAAQLAPLDAVFVTRTLVLNGVVGLVCGWLYWRRGLEMAMLAHFSADIVLHVLLPLLRNGTT